MGSDKELEKQSNAPISPARFRARDKCTEGGLVVIVLEAWEIGDLPHRSNRERVEIELPIKRAWDLAIVLETGRSFTRIRYSFWTG